MLTYPPSSFAGYVDSAYRSGSLIVQPRMGFGDPETMRRGLVEVRRSGVRAVGTITLDSYTRTGDYEALRRALDDGVPLNGFPLVTYPHEVTASVLEGVWDSEFPVQVRHGCPLPGDIFAAISDLGLDASEGGPVSYCLPYSRVPLEESIAAWSRACERFAVTSERGVLPHVESFGGCMLGQLCPPSLLLTLTVLEGMFFRAHGLTSVSLSYAQQTHFEQDLEALAALRRLGEEFLPDIDWHTVVYAYMGVYPFERLAAEALLRDAAELAVRGGAGRLLVKTPAEAHRIPTIAENVRSLRLAAAAAARVENAGAAGVRRETGIYEEARALIEAVLELGEDPGTALGRAFERGLLDVPYCLHPDNPGRARSYVDETGRLRWASVGAMPIGPVPGTREITGSDLLASLYYVQRKYDRHALREVRVEPEGNEPGGDLTIR
ncbi:Glutamate mutase subunit E [Actinopolyspora lacussalsi subsp. righensis]|uniref:Glutamate mutase subunit E n=1 Tax=Actinopolyspora righensis TaxID=995060 RepID=A0A1I7BAZ0_9ACTN|nr:methylaspartate mutase [Actinopolyspora righensis]SFT84380.1 Glutamate mutase subunit E [Actinopolyspora righensis]